MLATLCRKGDRQETGQKEADIARESSFPAVNWRSKQKMLDLKFEKFRGGQSDRFGLAETARATINRRGMIYLNTKMYEKIGRPPAVALYFNRKESIIAIEPAFDRSPEHFQVYKKQSGWSIHASTFCRHYRIRVPNTERFLYPYVDSDGALHLDLRETITVGGIERDHSQRTGFF